MPFEGCCDGKHRERGGEKPRGTERKDCRIEKLTARLFPLPDVSASRAPGPILLLRDFFRDSAIVVPMSIVAFSLSTAFLGETPVVDFRGRLVAGTVTSAWGAIVSVVDEVRVQYVFMRVKYKTCGGGVFGGVGGDGLPNAGYDWSMEVNKPYFLFWQPTPTRRATSQSGLVSNKQQISCGDGNCLHVGEKYTIIYLGSGWAV